MNTMSWPISGAAALALAALVVGCEQPPARHGAGVSFAPLWLPNQIARSPRRQVHVTSAPAMSDFDRDIDWPQDAASAEPTPAPAVRPTAELPDVGLAPGLGISSVHYAPPRSSDPPAGTLSIAQVILDFPASASDTATDAIDALARRLSQGLQGWNAEPQK